MRVIIVDDEVQALQLFLSQIVGREGFEYRFFKDEHEAIIDYVKNNDDITGAFLDINMPSINGIALAKELLKIKPDLKIIFITGTDVKKDNLPEVVRANLIDVIYKPYSYQDIENAINALNKKEVRLHVHMFGHFDCFINRKVVLFSSFKSKELFALLVSLNGKSLTMTQAISYLWPDKDLEKAKILYRDAVWRLRSTLNQIRFQCIDFQRALLVLDKSHIKCDYYEVLEGKREYHDESFLSDYDWSMDIENELAFISKNKK